MLDKFFNDSIKNPGLMVGNSQTINEADPKPPKGEKSKNLDSMKEALARTKKDEGRPGPVIDGEVDRRGPKNSMNMNDDFPGFWTNQKDVGHTIFRLCFTEDTRGIRRKERGIGMVSRKET